MAAGPARPAWTIPRGDFGSLLAASAKALAGAARRNLAAEQDRWFPWCIVAFGSGITIYFGLSTEPAPWMALATAVVSATIAAAGLRAAGMGVRFACAIIAAAGLGFAAAKLRTDTVSAPIIARDMGPLGIEGRIESVSDRVNGARIVLRPSRLGRDNAQDLPRRLRLSVRYAKGAPGLVPGEWVSLVALLHPPPAPAIPHGYDFARTAFFDGLGGVGFTFGTPKPIAPAWPETLWERIAVGIEGLRHSMTLRVHAALPGPNGAIAAALITGDRGAIEEDDNAAFRDSGLAHVLSISGLHMALAGLGIFWAVRAVLALSPRLALNYPIKKWAAVAALGASAFYLLISGGGPAPTRSFIMLAAMLLGVLVDRPALTMRPVAIAALLILAVAPESLIDPGFQMSFSAIVGLIALAEWQGAKIRASDGRPFAGFWSITGLWRAGRGYVWGVVLSTTVATLATAPFAIFHFDRAVGYAILANVLAMPPVGFVIMPAAALSVILMPFGLDYWPLQAMGWGVQIMMDVAHWVGGLPGAVVLVPAWPTPVLLVVVAGGLWIGLWRRPWRWLGLAPIAAGLALAITVAPPDLIVARDAQMVAVRQPGGMLTIIGPHPDDYTAGQWLTRAGDARDAAAAGAEGTCDDMGCVAMGSGGRVVALALRQGALVDDCARADVLVSAVPVRGACPHPKLVIDRLQVAREGAAAVWLDEETPRVETVTGTRGARPWSAPQYRRMSPTSLP